MAAPRMNSTTDRYYEFGPFRLHPAKRLLRRGETPVALTAKVFDLLLLLVENSDTLLEREELMNALWPHASVEESNLTQSIFVLRKTLGETRQGERFIVTVPGRGYRFVATVQAFQEQGHEQGGTLLPAASLPARRIASIAILPLKIIGADKAIHYLGAGIADAIIAVLSSASGLLVRPTTAILKYGAHGQDPMQAGRELKVEAVLDGTIQQSGDRLRVSVQLIKVNTGTTLWAERFDEGLTEVFTLQDSIAEQVARQIRHSTANRAEEVETLPPTRHHASHQTRLPDLDVWQLYIKGRYFQDKRTAEGLHKSIACANEVIALARDFARGYACLADSYNLLGEYLYLAPHEAFPPARAAVQQALALDPTLAEAHASHAEILMFYDRDWGQAEREYQTAIILNPNYAAAHHWYAWLLMMLRRFDEALHHLRLAQRIDPASLYIKTALGLPYYYQGHYDQAIQHHRQALEMDASFAAAHYYLGEALVQQGAYEAALQEFAQTQMEHAQQSLALRGHTLARSGRTDEARQVLHQLQTAANYVSPYCLAVVYAGLEDTEAALQCLAEAWQERAAWLVFLQIDPFLAGLRNEDRFVALAEQIFRRLAAT